MPEQKLCPLYSMMAMMIPNAEEENAVICLKEECARYNIHASECIVLELNLIKDEIKYKDLNNG